VKLFVWQDVLTDYTSGIMFALANSVEEAREVICPGWAEQQRRREAGDESYLSIVQFDLGGAPDVYDAETSAAVGFTIWGGS